MHRVVNVAPGLAEFFGLSHILSPDGTLTSRLFFAKKDQDGGGSSGHQEIVEDEPQLRKRNPYALELRRLLYGPQVTAESIERRAELRRIGPELERYAHRVFRNKKVRVALFPLGSSLKGYSGPASDIEFTIAILDGQRSRPDALVSEAIFQKGNVLLKERGYRGEAYMPDMTSIINASPFALKEVQRHFESSPRPPTLFWEHVGRYYATLFLPATYTNGLLLEKARKTLLSFFLSQKEAEEIWKQVQLEYLCVFRGKSSTDSDRSHPPIPIESIH